MSDLAPHALQHLLDLEAIRTLKSRYLRGLDEQDWDGVRELLTDDLEFHHPTIGHFTEADAMVSAVRERVVGVRTVHQGHDPEITLHGDTADGQWGLQSFVFSDTDPSLRIPRFARYHDRFRRENGQWRMSFIELVYQFDGAPQ